MYVVVLTGYNAKTLQAAYIDWQRANMDSVVQSVSTVSHNGSLIMTMLVRKYPSE